MYIDQVIPLDIIIVLVLKSHLRMDASGLPVHFSNPASSSVRLTLFYFSPYPYLPPVMTLLVYSDILNFTHGTQLRSPGFPIDLGGP